MFSVLNHVKFRVHPSFYFIKKELGLCQNASASKIDKKYLISFFMDTFMMTRVMTQSTCFCPQQENNIQIRILDIPDTINRALTILKMYQIYSFVFLCCPGFHKSVYWILYTKYVESPKNYRMGFNK